MIYRDAPGAMPTNGVNGYDVSVVGEGSGPDAKAARPAENPRWAAGRGPGVGSGPGGGVTGHSRELLRGALVYAARGVPVFPCEPGGKRPLTADGFLEATTDEVRIRRWWARWPNANVAIPTGARSGLLVLDVDAGEGTDSVALLELSRGQPPKTARAATGGGGVHIYFRYPSPQELWAAGLYAREVRNSQGLLGGGLEVRDEKGRVRRLRDTLCPQGGRGVLLPRRGVPGGDIRAVLQESRSR